MTQGITSKEFQWPTTLDAEAVNTDLNPEQDELTLIIKAHLYIERVLVQIIEDSLDYPKELYTNELRFPTKIGLSSAMGLIPREVKEALFHMNFMRNRIAHDLKYKIDQAETVKLFGSFPETFRVMTLHKLARKGKVYTEENIPFGEVVKIILIYLDWLRHRHQTRREWLRNLLKEAKEESLQS